MPQNDEMKIIIGASFANCGDDVMILGLRLVAEDCIVVVVASVYQRSRFIVWMCVCLCVK